MGSGIAQWLSSRGVSVILRDVGTEELTRGLANIEKTYADAVKRGIMTEEKAKEGRARIVASSAPIEMRDVQIVIEAASEKLEIKRQIFRDLAAKGAACRDAGHEHFRPANFRSRSRNQNARARHRTAFL